MNRLLPHAKYLLYVLRHKFYVYQEGRKLGLPRLHLLVHDWQKFTPTEFRPYVNTFYGEKTPRRADGGYDPNAQGDAFDRAWNHHQKHGPHHWQFWIMPLDDGGSKILEMPVRYCLEMVADWRGAGRAINGHGPEKVHEETLKWYEANKDRMRLHPKTRALVEGQIGYRE